MAFTFSEAAVKRIVKDCLYVESLRRNERHRRRRHVTISTGASGTSGNVVMFRLEEELLVGTASNARIVDQSSLLTKPGPRIVVQDDEQKWFGRGEPAPSGDDGGDGKGDACFGIAMSTDVFEEGAESGGSSDESPAGLYSIISVGTWARYITGTLTGDTWVVLAQNVTFHDGEWVRADDGTDEGTITLYPLSCLEAADGVQFRAIFNEVLLRYDVWAACCPE